MRIPDPAFLHIIITETRMRVFVVSGSIGAIHNRIRNNLSPTLFLEFEHSISLRG